MDVFKDILNNLNDSIVIIDPFGQIVFYNKQALHIQKSISDKPVQIGYHFSDVVNDEYKHDITEILKAVRTKKKPITSFVECNTHAGTRIYFEMKFSPLLDNSGRIQNIHIISQDVTPRKILEGRARSVASDVSNLIEHAHALILSVDSQGYIVEWNNHCSQVIGFQKNEIFCKKASDILVAGMHRHLVNNLMNQVLKNHSVTNFRLPVQTKCGRETMVMISASPRTNVHGQVIGATWIGQETAQLVGYGSCCHGISC